MKKLAYIKRALLSVGYTSLKNILIVSIGTDSSITLKDKGVLKKITRNGSKFTLTIM